MKVSSDTRPEAVELLQGSKLINFDIKEVEITDTDSTDIRIGFEYQQVKVDINDTRGATIEAIVATRYSVGAEVALTNDRDIKVDEYNTYQDFRVLAKTLADTE